MLLAFVGLAGRARAQTVGADPSAPAARVPRQAPSSPSPDREPLSQAWFTGPMLTPGAGTLPRGHYLIEPYLYDVAAAHSNGYGSFTYLLYGLTDRFTVGLTPNGGYTRVRNGRSTSGLEMGDLSLQASIGLTQFHPGSWVPTVSALVEETFPTGHYDHLGNRPSDGYGSGAYTTTFGLYSQTYFWLPNGRLLRQRFNFTQAFSTGASVTGVSVYGTGDGFSGRAQPGASSYFDTSCEYSLTERWVLALDATYRHTLNTTVRGVDLLLPAHPPLRLDSGSSDSFAFAPGLEYNWSSRWGVLFALRIIPASHNTTPSLTPALAINFVH